MLNIPRNIFKRQWRLLLLFAYVSLLIVRAPHLLYPGRFWAEGGSIYFMGAENLSFWEYLSGAELGYYSLVNKMISLLAAYTVPLTWAPSLATGLCLLVQTVPAVAIIYCRSHIFRSVRMKIVVLMIILFAIPNDEVWLNIPNLQFHLCLATALIMVTEVETRRWHYVRLGILALAGMTGVVSLVFLPFYLLTCAVERTRMRREESLVLGFALVFQLIAMYLSPADRTTVAQWSYFPSILLVKQIEKCSYRSIYRSGCCSRCHQLFQSISRYSKYVLQWS